METRTKGKATLSLILNALIIGFSYLIVKKALNHSTPILILADRLVIAFLALFICRATGFIKIDKVDKPAKRKILLLSILYPIAFFILQNYGIKRVATSETAMIYGLIPAFTLLFSFFYLKQRANILQQVGVLSSVAGILYISINSMTSLTGDAWGYLLVSLSVMSMAGYYVFIKKNLQGISPLTITYYLITFATPAMIIVGLFTEGDFVDYARFVDISYILCILYLGILSTLVTSLLTNFAIKNLSPTQVSVFSNLNPIFGVFAGIIFMNEILTTPTIIGGIMIFLGVVLCIIKPNKK